MSTLSDLLAEHTSLPGTIVDHLQRVVAEWQLLSDLSFADFVMWVPLEAYAETPDDRLRFVCVAQARPTTGPTAHTEDMVGTIVTAQDHGLLRRVMLEGKIIRDADPRWHFGMPLRRETIPIRFEDEFIGVLDRDSNLSMPRVPSPLEIAYLGSAADLCQMIVDGSFPDPESTPDIHTSPRAGDGMLRLDTAGGVVYASPNALSAYHRMGHSADLTGAKLAPLTRSLVPDPFDATEAVQQIRAALAGKPGMRIEVDSKGATVLFRALPLRPRDEAAGALILVRDITEVRRRDRALLTKDATIREIHHRVKNNLQTVAALLRLQARRTENDEARRSLQESVRRIASISLVHETLSMSLDERVDIDDLVDKLLPVISEVSGAHSRIAVRRDGQFGVLAAELATPLAMVLTELVQNALEHGYEPGQAGEVVLHAERSARWLDVVVTDDGRGLPAAFSLERADRLGLQIVRTLVDSELRGSLSLRRRSPRGTDAVLRVPLSTRR